MALSLTGMDSDRVNHGSDSTLDNVGRSTDGLTVLWWMYNDALGSSSEYWFFEKEDGLRSFHPYWAGVGSINVYVPGATHSVELEVHSLLTTGTWQCVAAWLDPSLSTNFGELYYGTLTSPLASQSLDFSYREASTLDDSANDFAVGNSQSTPSRSIDGRIAMFALWSGKVPLANLITQQFSLYPIYTNGLRLFCNYGIHGSGGVGTQLDWSGNGNNGTITGATQADHAPIRIFPTFQFLTPPAAGGVTKRDRKILLRHLLNYEFSGGSLI